MKARKYFEQNRLTVIVGVAMTLILVTGLAIILPSANRDGTPATKPTPTPTTGVATPTPADNIPALAPGVVLGPQACAAAVKDPAHWDAILGNQGSDRKVEGVSCANVMGNSSLQALVTVRHSNANAHALGGCRAREYCHSSCLAKLDACAPVLASHRSCSLVWRCKQLL